MTTPKLVPVPGPDDLPPTIGAGKVAELLGIQHHIAVQLAKDGWLDSFAVDRTYRFSTNAVLRFLAGDQAVPHTTVELKEPSLLQKYQPRREAG